MNKKVLGITLLVVGVGLIAFGYNESQTLASKVTEVFSGNPSDKTMYFYVGGAVSALLGIFVILKK